MFMAMGIFARWKALKAMVNDVSSPFTTGVLTEVDSTALAALSADISREQAMAIPAICRARNLLCTTAARAILIAQKDGTPVSPQPQWINRTDGLLPPYHRMLWTIDDLLFYGSSLWRVTPDFDGHVLTADRVIREAWAIAADDTITVGDRPASADEYVLIPGIHQGILWHGTNAMPEANALARAVTTATNTPAATLEIHYTGDRPLSQDEKQSLTAGWVAARKGKNGGVAFTSKNTEIKEHGSFAEHLLIEGRNANAIDLARLCGIPASMIDASIQGSSINYSNAGLRMAELLAFGVLPLLACVTARMGMDDVVPRGTSIGVDASEMVEFLSKLNVQDDNLSAPVTTTPTQLPTEKEAQQ